MVGSLKRVGEGGMDVRLISPRRSQARDRAACGPVAPPDGLYLMKVDYPSDLIDAGAIQR